MIRKFNIPTDSGNNSTHFTTKTGLVVAQGYTRIVIGKRGPYVEFTDTMIDKTTLHVPKEHEYRLYDARVYYIELRTNDKSNVKVYFQLKTVAYADYKLGMYYISPSDLLIDNGIAIVN